MRFGLRKNNHLKLYTQILFNADFAKMNLLIRRLADKFEDQDNSLTNGRQNFVQLGTECDKAYFDDTPKNNSSAC